MPPRPLPPPRRRRRRTVTAARAAGALLAALVAPRARAATPPHVPRPEAAAPAASLPADGLPAAEVGVRPIWRQELDAAVQQNVNSGAYFHRLAGERLREMEEEQLLELVRRSWSFYGGLERGLPLPVEQARAAAQAIESRLGKSTYASGLAQRGWTREDHVRSLAESLLSQLAYRCFVAEPARVTASEVRAAYDAEPGRWRVPESRHVLHILLAVAPGASPDLAGAREKEAQEIARQVRADRTGAEFAAVAARVTEGPYRVKGGDLGWAHRGRLVEPLESAVWKAAPGDVVGPLRGDDGWHLAMVVGERPARIQPFEEVFPVLGKELEASRLREKERAWYGGLAAGYPVLVWEHGLELKGAP